MSFENTNLSPQEVAVHEHNLANQIFAEEYVETVREHYRNGDGQYRGTRNEEQQEIAEITSNEARVFVDGTMAGLLAIGGSIMPEDYETTVKKVGYEWKDFRAEFEKLLVGVSIITQRLHRDGYGIESYLDLDNELRDAVTSHVFSDFLAHNALRFGVDTAGLRKSRMQRVPTEDGGMDHVVVVVDKDKAKTEKELALNMVDRGYRTGKAQHAAAKISPAKYKSLRRSYPEMDKTAFDREVSFYQDVENYFAEQE